MRDRQREREREGERDLGGLGTGGVENEILLGVETVCREVCKITEGNENRS